MAERWGTSEGRSAAVYFEDVNGVPQTALAPVALSWRKSDGAVQVPPAVTAIAGGFYRLDWAAAPTTDLVVRVDGGAALGAAQFIALEIPVGGVIDRLDVAVSTRESAGADVIGVVS